MKKGTKITLYDERRKGTVTSLKMRVYDGQKRTPMLDWASILISVTIDGAKTPQLVKIPLGSLFGATGGTNNIYSAMFGKSDMECDLEKAKYPVRDTTGYFYFPMPFWKSAKITLEGTKYIRKTIHVCYELTIQENNQSEETTGYFHAAKTYYTGGVELWRKVIDLKKSWGSFVGITVELDKVKSDPGKFGALGWAVYESDPIIFVDGRKTAVTIGSGLEDYFNVAHCWRDTINSSFAFVGLFHASPRFDPRIPILTRHAYRLQVLDPIPFHNSFSFLMEGTSGKSFEFERDLGYDAFMKLKTEGKPTVSYMAFYYAKHESGLTKTDAIILSDQESRQSHHYSVDNKMTERHQFTILGSSYLASYPMNRTTRADGAVHHKHTTVRFNLKIRQLCKSVLLRREFYTVPREFNQKAQISINGVDHGIWFIPMGSITEKYALMDDDFLIGEQLTRNLFYFHIEIRPFSAWYDISYSAFCIH